MPKAAASPAAAGDGGNAASCLIAFLWNNSPIFESAVRQAGGVPATKYSFARWFKKGETMKKVMALVMILGVVLFFAIGCSSQARHRLHPGRRRPRQPLARKSRQK